jgi:hypothetical protein
VADVGLGAAGYAGGGGEELDLGIGEGEEGWEVAA